MTRKPHAELVTVARIQKVHGRRGEVAAQIWTDFPERFQHKQEFLVAEEDPPRTLFLEGSWFHKGRAILKFRGCDTISAAEALVGLTLQIRRADRRSLPPATVYVSDLVGCAVVEHGRRVGIVIGWEETGGVPLLRVQAPEGEVLIPFAQEICGAVDLERKEIRAWLPEGLKELNRTASSPPRRQRAGRPSHLPKR